MEDIIEELRVALPPIIAGPRISDLTGGVIHWATIQNKRSRGEIPDECFFYQGRRVVIRRDRFLTWWGSTISDNTLAKGAAK